MSRILYVTDLDGTLLNTHDRINKESLAIINDLVKRGMLFTYATARSLVSTSIVTQGLSMDIPIIAYNGAFIIHPSTGEILSKESFTREDMKQVIDVLDSFDIYPLVYSYVEGEEKVSWIVTEENEGIRRYLSLRKGDKRLRPISSKEELYQGDMFYFTCIGEREELQPVWCEIMPANATKAEAIHKLKQLWNCDKVVSFGDAVNDIPMFEISDECYAVENAVEELKILATGIIDSNDNDGVAKWLKKHAII